MLCESLSWTEVVQNFVFWFVSVFGMFCYYRVGLFQSLCSCALNKLLSVQVNLEGGECYIFTETCCLFFCPWVRPAWPDLCVLPDLECGGSLELDRSSLPQSCRGIASSLQLFHSFAWILASFHPIHFCPSILSLWKVWFPAASIFVLPDIIHCYPA